MSESDLIPDENAQPEQAAVPAKAKRKKRVSIFRDPVVRVMAIIATGLVVLYLVTVVSALLMGVLGSTEPRSRVERDVQYYEASAMRAPNDPAAWRRYVLALIADRQYQKAQKVIDQAGEAVDQTATQDILLSQAELHFAREQYDDAIKTAEEVRKKLDAYHKKALEKSDSDESKGKEVSENTWAALLIIAESQLNQGNNDEALKAFDEYLEQYKTAADVFVRRGNLRADMGDKEGAEKDFRQALVFLPDDDAALEGLEKIGASK